MRSNVNLFKRHDYAHDTMARATMPKAAQADVAVAKPLVASMKELVAVASNGARLVKAVA